MIKPLKKELVEQFNLLKSKIENSNIDLTYNEYLDLLLERYFFTIELTLDKENSVSKENISFINKFIFKRFRKDLKDLDKYFKGYRKQKEIEENSYYYNVKQQEFLSILFKKLKKNKKADFSAKE